MAPWIPRLHLFEIDDQPWFPPFLRAYVQDGLRYAWQLHIPVLEPRSPAALAASLLLRVLGRGAVADYTYIDFCAGAGGPTPLIEQALNEQLRESPSGSSTTAAAAAKDKKQQNEDDDGGVHFVLTDLHPNVEAWEIAARKSKYMSYVAEPVDAANAPPELVGRYTSQGKKVFRLFNLAFHHFEDPLAKAILKNTVETSDGFAYVFLSLSLKNSRSRTGLYGIFELQDRSFSSFISILMFGILILLLAPFYYWSTPLALVWVYIFPVVPFVLVFDGWISSLRTREPDEVEALLRTCGANADDWVIKSGKEMFIRPTGWMTWFICQKK